MAKPLAPLEFTPIGVIRTSFLEKFGIPRQPGLVPAATGVIELTDDPDLRTALRGLETFSHLWVLFVFHEHGSKNWKPSIRPPRLGGAQKVGVLASRSPHRPNPIGLSAVKLERIDFDHPDGARVYVSGVDILDQSPILDLKPYLPYADSLPDARAGWADEPIARYAVQFETKALEQLSELEPDAPKLHTLRALIEEMLAIDPRPAFQKRRSPIGNVESEGERYGIAISGYDVKWTIREGAIWVTALERL